MRSILVGHAVTPPRLNHPQQTPPWRNNPSIEQEQEHLARLDVFLSGTVYDKRKGKPSRFDLRQEAREIEQKAHDNFIKSQNDIRNSKGVKSVQ